MVRACGQQYQDLRGLLMLASGMNHSRLALFPLLAYTFWEGQLLHPDKLPLHVSQQPGVHVQVDAIDQMELGRARERVALQLQQAMVDMHSSVFRPEHAAAAGLPPVWAQLHAPAC